MSPGNGRRSSVAFPPHWRTAATGGEFATPGFGQKRLKNRGFRNFGKSLSAPGKIPWHFCRGVPRLNIDRRTGCRNLTGRGRGLSE
jgi:hypothetical protein